MDFTPRYAPRSSSSSSSFSAILEITRPLLTLSRKCVVSPPLSSSAWSGVFRLLGRVNVNANVVVGAGEIFCITTIWLEEEEEGKTMKTWQQQLLLQGRGGRMRKS